MRTVLEALKIVNSVARDAVGMDLRSIKRAKAMRESLELERVDINKTLFASCSYMKGPQAVDPMSAELSALMKLSLQGSQRARQIEDINSLQSTSKERAALVESVRGIFSGSIASMAFELSPTTGNAIDDILAVCDLFDAAADMTINDIMAEISDDIFSEA